MMSGAWVVIFVNRFEYLKVEYWEHSIVVAGHFTLPPEHGGYAARYLLEDIEGVDFTGYLVRLDNLNHGLGHRIIPQGKWDGLG